MRISLIGIIILLMGTFMRAQTPVVDLQSVISGFSAPVAIVNAGDNRLFVVERSGTIQIIDLMAAPIAIFPDPFLDISALLVSGGERGLLGLAFHPQYTTNGYFFVNYTRQSDGATVIARFQVTANPDSADANSELVLYTASQPYTNHNGGDIAFGPNDGFLYVATGDGGSGGDPGNRSQDPLSPMGKILRFDVNVPAPYIPVSNPFVGNPAVLDEIWALGLRNPWRISFDRQTHDLWMADVGQGALEEIDMQPSASAGGENYGWRCYEGNSGYNTTGCPPIGTFVAPVHQYTHADGCSVTGGYVYRGTAYTNLVGHYLYGDFCNGNMWSLRSNGAGGWINMQHSPATHNPGNISTFGEDANGEVYVANLNGNLFRIIDNTPQPVEFLSFDASVREAAVVLTWATATEKNNLGFEVEMKKDFSMEPFEQKGFVHGAGNSNAKQTYGYTIENLLPGRYLFRLKQVDVDGKSTFSKTVLAGIDKNSAFFARVIPNPFQKEAVMEVVMPTSGTIVYDLYDSEGKTVLSSKKESLPVGKTRLLIPHEKLSPGIYLFRVSLKGYPPLNGKILKY